MRNLFIVTLFCLLISATAVQAAELNIGVFDLQKVATDSEALKATRAEIDKKFGKQKSDLEQERENIEKKAKDFQKKRPTEKQQQALQKQHQDYSQKAQAFMKLLQAEEVRFQQDMENQIAKAAKEVAVKKGLALVLNKAAAPYFDPKFDVTADVLTELNTLTKSSGNGN